MVAAIEEPMPSEIFDKLTSCDPELAWSLCRNDIGYQLLGKDNVTVPFLDEAYLYVPFGVIAKRKRRESGKSGSCSLGMSKTNYGLIGTMATLVPQNVDKSVFQQQPKPVLDSNINSSYVYKVVGQKGGVKKSVKVKVEGTKCFDVCLSMQLGQLMVDTTLQQMKDVKKIYIIYQVFYANHISINVTIGEQIPGNSFMDTINRKFVHDRRMPVGFSVQKFPIMQDGTVGFMEKTRLDGLRNGKWKRVERLPTDPLPSLPQQLDQGSSSNRNGSHHQTRRHPQDMLPKEPGLLPHEDGASSADPYGHATDFR
jgi:hypothetical protein